MNVKITTILAVWLAITGLNIALLPGRYAPHVEVEIVASAPLPLIVRASGNLEAKDSNTVKAQFDGPVVSKEFREGQKVNKGQLLAVIGRDRLQVDYQNRKDALSNAEADLTHSRRDLRLQKALFAKGAVAYSTVEDAKRAVVKAEQALRIARDSMSDAQSQWDSARVLAPISGTVVRDWIGEDKVVTSGKELITVADVSAYTLHAKVDELDIHQVHEGQKADVTVQIFQQTTLPAVVTEVGSQVEGTGLPEIPVVLSVLDTKGLELRPKLTAEARMVTAVTEPVISIPLTALVNNDGNPHAWILNALNRLERRDVEQGRSNPERIEITRGLSPHERVCVTAEPDFADGMHAVIGRPDSSRRTAQFLPPPKKEEESSNKKSSHLKSITIL